jgi:hypothetical protein
MTLRRRLRYEAAVAAAVAAGVYYLRVRRSESWRGTQASKVIWRSGAEQLASTTDSATLQAC